MAIRKYKGLTFKTKLIFLCSTLILISVISASVFSYMQYKRNSINTTYKHTVETSAQLSINLKQYTEEMIRTSMLPYYNSELITSIQENNRNSMEQLLHNRFINNFLENTLIYPQEDILRVFLITDRVYLGSRNYESLDSLIDFRQLSWYNKAIQDKAPFFLSNNKESLIKDDYAEIFSIVRPIFGGERNADIIGIIKVDARFDGIINILNTVSNGKKGGVVLSDESGNILYSSLGDNLSNADILGIQKDSLSNQAVKTSLNKKEYLTYTIPIEGTGWHIYSLNSLDELNQNAAEMRNRTLYFAFTCSVLMLIIVILSIQNFLNPLFSIIRLMKQVKSGNLSVRFPEQRNDEIGYLGKSFNSMVSQISHIISDNTQLVKQVYETNLLEQEAKLNALTRQIRPHFIYNTLNMISIMIQSNQADEAVESIENLSGMIRKITKMAKNIPLSLEVSLIHEYLYIQKARFSEKLGYTVHIHPELDSFIIPSLILQPLVENAVIHGCEGQNESITIKIYSEFIQEDVCLFVTDNGPGIPANSLAEIHKLLGDEESERENQQTTGIGLLNVHQRIRKQFGAPYGLEISSQPHLGTSIKIVLPLKQQLRKV